jgi:hypothetical protein
MDSMFFVKENSLIQRTAGLCIIVAGLLVTGSVRIFAEDCGKNRNTFLSNQMLTRAIPFLKVKQTDSALVYLDKAVNADPCNISALWEGGWAYYQAEKWQKVCELWGRVKELQPSTPGLSINLKMAQERAAVQMYLDTVSLSKTAYIDTIADMSTTIAVTAVGDIQLGRAWPDEYAALPAGGPEELLDQVSQYLKDDITFGNLETVLSNTGGTMKGLRGKQGIFVFRVPVSYATGLKKAGFTVLGTANNHANDFKTEGMYSTMSALDSAGILHSGKTGIVASWIVKGLRVCMVAYSNQESAYTIQDSLNVYKRIRSLSLTHDIVIVSFHGGAEGRQANRVMDTVENYYGENRGNVFKFAHWAVDAGADLVLGHGPHVLRGMERYRGRLIAYSMGNFSSYKSFVTDGALSYSIILKVSLAKNGVCKQASVIPLIFNADGKPGIDNNKNAVTILNTLSTEDLRSAAVVFDSSGHAEFTKQQN